MVLTPEKIKKIREEILSVPPEERDKKIAEIISKLSPDEVEQLKGGVKECPFCAMTLGKIPVKKIYEDNEVMAILDINPIAKGHTLVFPKRHYTYLTEMGDKEIGYIFSVTNKIAIAIMEALGATGFNLFVVCGESAGQKAPHVLINIIPRFDNDGLEIKFPQRQANEKELEELASKIREKSMKIKIGKEKEIVKKEVEEKKYEKEYPLP